MRDERLSVTEAARNFADCVNRARYQNTSFVLLKNGLPVAKLTPYTGDKVCTGADLAAILQKVSLSDEESAAWSADLERARTSLVPAEDKWR